MTLRTHLDKLEKHEKILKINQPISKDFEIAGVLKELEPRPIIFENVKESSFKVMGNLFCSKESFAEYFGITTKEIIPLLTYSINNRSEYEVVTNAPCQELIMDDPDLDQLPILMHCEKDGGNYISAGVFITSHPKYGQNADYHRSMQFSKTEMTVRIVRGRHFDTFLRDLGQVDVAICLGNAPNVLAAAATSVEIGVDELEIANAMEPLKVVKAKTVDVFVPAETEIVIEGTVYLDRTHAEGPFVDLTGTYDIIRDEPVFEVKAITHRKDAIWQALLPGALEHKLLMGMPREPTIFRKVNEVVKCLDVNINPGGCSWLHAIVQIDKQSKEDPKKAIQAAFDGHGSCKHVFIVDSDIDIYNPSEIEWAMATRFQGNKDLVIFDKAPGSSLDPSAEFNTKNTTRIGFDLTKPLGNTEHFDKAEFPKINLESFLSDSI
ncbi:MAG: UbiD family decarboxylase [Chloroflexi bacterium]|jgi:2,5-furandicarboxylate decarboxylase 1|nr:UbiD family decarboxylase [Chloroflexota bacterium]MBT4002559.1 UbiD family decarboxylase [Chloroflexota bacterium]MBT4305825.1 UbiD family decarboxylase [Chloroflexota bacterium]MBT4533649.1 UbiD family decarboxylase [Chloroflexota bacterium]MBT4681708.1 UbiD family decarboxylase [Chloroflexota bacterium]